MSKTMRRRTAINFQAARRILPSKCFESLTCSISKSGYSLHAQFQRSSSQS